MKLSDLTARVDTVIDLAGPRYTPGIDAAAPNLSVERLFETCDALTLAPQFRDQIEGYAAELEACWEKAKRSFPNAYFGRRKNNPASVLEVLRDPRLGCPARAYEVVPTLVKRTKQTPRSSEPWSGHFGLTRMDTEESRGQTNRIHYG